MLRRHDRDANVDIGAPDPQPRGAVLRQPPFGDVEVGDDLDAGNHGLRQHAGRRRNRPQQAVDPHADHEPSVKGLDVNVARAQFDRLFQEIVDRAHHRRAAGEIAQAFDVVFAQLHGRAAAGVRFVFAETPVENDREVLDVATLIATAAPSTISAARCAAWSVGSATASTALPPAAR